MDRSDWIDRYAAAWRARSPEDVVRLFTPDAVYFYSPTEPPRVGHEQIAAHWQRSTGSFLDLDLSFGEPITQGDRTSVEMWATMRDPAWYERRTGGPATAGQEWITFPGVLMLRFTPDGRCAEHREYYNIVFGERIDPPPGWSM